MFRTRDFLLLFATIMFLLTAIAGTIMSRSGIHEQAAVAIQFVTDTQQGFTAELHQTEELPRDERLAQMRKKITESTDIFEESPVTVEVLTEDAGAEDVLLVDGGETTTRTMLCPGYQQYRGLWTPQGVQFSDQEGARLVYRESALSVGTDIFISEQQQEVLLQLPLQPTILAQPTCLDSDVVGIAQDGSLIRNSETSLYGVFGENTLVGYARDGVPIYGSNTIATDLCGGVVVEGKYRYYLSEQRETILNCFSAQPVSL